MGRPTDADSAQTVDAILAAATDLLTESDEAADPPSLRAVAAAAGVSVGTIQYYFPNREELFEACLDAYYERLANVATSFIGAKAGVEDPGALVEQAARALFQWARSERALLALRGAMNVARGELHPRRQRDFMGGFIEQAAKALGPHAQLSELELRMTIQMMASVVSRFALMTDSEVGFVTGLEPEPGRAELEAFVARSARRLVRLNDTH